MAEIIALIEELIVEVQNSSLDEKDQEKLIKKLETAITFLENNPPKVQAACGKMKAFANQVNAFINSGAITPVEGEELIDFAQYIRNMLGCYKYEK